jgi:hypothetical protein
MLGGLIVLLRESFCRSAFGQCELMSGTFVIENRRVWKLELASQLPFVTIFGLRITLERLKVMFIVVHHVEAEDISEYKKLLLADAKSQRITGGLVVLLNITPQCGWCCS